LGRRIFLSFKPTPDRFIARLPMAEISEVEGDVVELLSMAEEIYGIYIARMKNLVNEINELRKLKKFSARVAWVLGDLIFELRDRLGALSFQLDGIYEHLTRDLGANKKWLEKVVILRRYLPDKEMIPPDLKWGYFEHSTRRKAEQLREDYYRTECRDGDALLPRDAG